MRWRKKGDGVACGQRQIAISRRIHACPGSFYRSSKGNNASSANVFASAGDAGSGLCDPAPFYSLLSMRDIIFMFLYIYGAAYGEQPSARNNVIAALSLAQPGFDI